MKTAGGLLRDNLRYMTTDHGRWRGLFADDAVWEFAYGASADIPSPVNGIEAIAQGVNDFLAMVEDFRFGTLTIHSVAGEDAVFGEFEGHGRVIKTGKAYRQNYVFYVRARNGKIVFIREYFDPSRILAAFH